MIEFAWHVPTGGFQWRDDAEGSSVETDPPLPASWRCLVAHTTSWRRYQPLTDEPALFRKFADLAPTEASILVFANRYGGLGVRELIHRANGRPVQGESFERWQQELRAFKAVLRVWDAFTVQAYEDLAEWMQLETSRYRDELEEEEFDRYIRCRPSTDSLEARLEMPVRWWSTGGSCRRSGDSTTRNVPTDPVGFAVAYVRERVNERLRDHTSMRLLHRERAPGGLPLGLSVVPVNLLGAMWLQCARAIEGDGRYQRCPQCQEWFKVPPKALRENTTYCSPRCRVAAFRARRREKSGGLPVRAVDSTALPVKTTAPGVVAEDAEVEAPAGREG
jgi:hypothetical protein